MKKLKHETQTALKYSMFPQIFHRLDGATNVYAIDFIGGQGWNCTTDTRIFSPGPKHAQPHDAKRIIHGELWNIASSYTQISSCFA